MYMDLKLSLHRKQLVYFWIPLLLSVRPDRSLVEKGKNVRSNAATNVAEFLNLP